MLVLSRKESQVICIGDNIRLMVVRIGPKSVRIGIQAPGHINIVREELRTPKSAPASFRTIDASGQDELP